ncbi:(5-formylfuran-3-yl)methyl phosphate synthase [Paraburkholderia sp. JHI2823]|uniref:(5-formylfuran-3-yl)methyl phosphate synthase n=1 Tax=Paraburkholderia TaxID=1822464 RepID=UPI0004058EE9|nr:(5-formylfuran-3-yl)methyl phosphate synthase [Paraburkholderia mimosarum]
MTRLLTSVRDLAEAREAAAAGADFIDLKEPRAGALGALAPADVARIVCALRETYPDLPVSATIGDLQAGDHAAIIHHANRIGRCGVDYVKAGVAPGPTARETLTRMRALRWTMVPVLLCDDGLDLRLVEHACELGFAAVMADTARKDNGSLFHCVPLGVLDSMVRIAHAHEVMVGLAGALRLEHVWRVRALLPDFAGFRSALCSGARTGRLDAARVRELRAVLSGAVQAMPHEAVKAR